LEAAWKFHCSNLWIDKQNCPLERWVILPGDGISMPSVGNISEILAKIDFLHAKSHKANIAKFSVKMSDLPIKLEISTSAEPGNLSTLKTPVASAMAIPFSNSDASLKLSIFEKI
jgi:hypothetical protein